MSNSLWPHGLQHARLPCLWPSPGACLNSCPLSQWCHPTISSSVIPFSSCFQSFPASGSFQRRLFASGGQIIGASASALVPPMNIQDWFPLGLTCLISLLSKGLVRVFSSTTIQKQQFFSSHIHTWWLEKPQLWLHRPLLAKWYLCFLICYLGLFGLGVQNEEGLKLTVLPKNMLVTKKHPLPTTQELSLYMGITR